jgi:hypothetical protein
MTVHRGVIRDAQRWPLVSVEFDGNPIRIYRADKASSVELLSPIALHAPAAVQLAQACIGLIASLLLSVPKNRLSDAQWPNDRIGPPKDYRGRRPR